MDVHDYHLKATSLFSDIPREKTIALFKDITNSVSVDLFIEADVQSLKVVQVEDDLTVGQFVTNVINKKFT